MQLLKSTNSWVAPRRVLLGTVSIVVSLIVFVGALGIGLATGDPEVGHLQQRVAILSLVLFAFGFVALVVKRISVAVSLVVLAALLVYGGGVSKVLPFEIDDAYISMRYAQHLAEGHGLVFNIGGPRVEGYTNFLLVLIEAGLMKLGLFDLWPVKLITTGCGFLTLLVIAWYGYRRLGSATNDRLLLNVLVGASLLMTASSSPILLWSAGGLETMLFACLICLSAVLYSTYLLGWAGGMRTWLIDGVLFLAVLTRPEGLLFWALTCTHTLALWLFRRQQPSRARWIGLAAGAAMIIAYLLWKQTYFGQVLPLTYLAKESSFNFLTILGGGKRFVAFAAINGNFLVFGVLALGLLWALRRRVSLKEPLWYILLLIAFYGAYVISRGYRVAMDDAYRLWTPAVPLVSLLAAELSYLILRQSSGLHTQTGIRVLVSVTVTALVILLPIRMLDLGSAWAVDLNWGALSYRISARQVAYGLQDGHIQLGKWLRTHADPDATIVLYDAGAIPYFSGLRTIDTWSLSDSTIIGYRRALSAAHSPEDAELVMEQLRSYVLQQEPEYIVEDNLQLLDIPTVREIYNSIGMDFTYLSAYYCGGGMCEYVLTPQRRIGTQ